jgi:hypothetical protein
MSPVLVRTVKLSEPPVETAQLVPVVDRVEDDLTLERMKVRFLIILDVLSVRWYSIGRPLRRSLRRP